MAEACASSPSASLDDEGPVMDKHGDGNDSDREVTGGTAPTPRETSNHDISTEPKPEVKPVQFSHLPNGCISHKSCDDTSGGILSEYDKSKCDTGISSNNHTNGNTAPASLEGATAVTVNSLVDNSCGEPESKPSSSSQENSACDAISDSLSQVNLSDDSETHEGDGIKLDCKNGIEYVVYESEIQMPDIMRLITKDLSEPYSIYTYRYFIHNWPKLCFLAMDGKNCVGAIVCKLDLHKKMVRRGYIAMLAVDQSARRRGIGSHLVMKAIKAMVADDCDEVVLETEITNKAALHLYENLGFVRDKRLFRYYLNGVDALRLKLWLR